VRIVGFEEWQRPTIIRNLASRGRFLIDESSGRVLRTELEIGRGFPPPNIVTMFKFDESLQLMVPSEMREAYGVATYSRYRRFTVRTDESIR